MPAPKKAVDSGPDAPDGHPPWSGGDYQRCRRGGAGRQVNGFAGAESPGRLNLHTQQHIQAVADRLGYHPNPVARALGTQRTQTLALLLPNLSNQLFFGVIRGAEEQAAAAGYTLVLADSKGDPDQETARINRLTGAVDGFILVAARMPQG